LNWFENIIADIINALANGIQALSGMSLPDVIASAAFPNESQVPPLGAGNFSALMDQKSVISLAPMANALWAFAWTFFIVAIYLLASQISSANNSAVGRERLKRGFVGLAVAAIGIWQGPHLATFITQLFYYPTLFFLHMSHVMNWTPLSTSGGQALLNSGVNFFQAIMALIIWIIYEFRRLFLFVWMVMFPLFMAFYANEKTKGLAKMWWIEWIYQMAVPLGQSIVFGVASAIAAPVNKTQLTAADIFVALAGTIGLIASAVYVRKIVMEVAKNFGGSMLGFAAGETAGHIAALGMGAAAFDVAGKLAVKGGVTAIGNPLKAAVKKVDNLPSVRRTADASVRKNPELFAAGVKAGASVDDIMLHHQMGAHGDVLNADGAELESAVGGGGSTRMRTPSGSFGHAGVGTRATAGRSHPIFHSRTAGALRDAPGSVRSTLASTNLGLIARGKLNEFRSQGGVTGKVQSALATQVSRMGHGRQGMLGQGAAVSERYLADQDMKQTRLTAMRGQMNEVLDLNTLATRLPHIHPMYDKEAQDFTGLTKAEEVYSHARGQLVGAFQSTMNMPKSEALDTVRRMQSTWESGRHIPNWNRYPAQVQTEYHQAFNTFRPAHLDQGAKAAVIAGRLAMNLPNHPHQNKRAGVQALMADARSALAYKR